VISSDFGPFSRALLLAAAAVIVIAGLKLGGPIIVPLLLAACIAAAAAPLVGWLEQRRVPPALAVTAGILCALAAVLGFGLVLTLAAGDLANTLPALESELLAHEGRLVAWLTAHRLETLAAAISSYDPGIRSAALLEGTVLGASRFAGVFGVVLFVTIFVLLEAPTFRDKLERAFGFRPERMAETRRVVAEVQRYLVLKTALNAIAGVAAGGWCYLMGVPDALLWGVVAFVLHFVPVFGSVISAVPPLVVALVLKGPGSALGVAIGYIAFNNLIGNLVEPKILGKKAGLSALVVTVSIVIWGWILGPVGALLSVPLTMIARIAFAHFEDTEWIAVLLGPGAGTDRNRETANTIPIVDSSKPCSEMSTSLPG
jgi:predicted PurR-regulated permease PerM